MKLFLILVGIFTAILASTHKLSISRTGREAENFWWQGPNSPFRPGAGRDKVRPAFSPPPSSNGEGVKLNTKTPPETPITVTKQTTPNIPFKEKGQLNQFLNRLKSLEDDLEIKLKNNDRTGVKGILSRLNKEVLPPINEFIIDHVANLRKNGFNREVNLFFAKQKAATSRILYKAGIIETCDEMQAFYDGTGRCEKLPINPYLEVPINGPCPSKQHWFLIEDEERRIGICDCKIENYPGDQDECYMQHTRGFCDDGEWIIQRNGKLICEKVPANCPSDGDHVFEVRKEHSNEPKCYGKKSRYSFFFESEVSKLPPKDQGSCERGKPFGSSLMLINGTCYAENTQGFCPDGEWMVQRDISQVWRDNKPEPLGEIPTVRSIKIPSEDPNLYLICEKVPVNCPADGYHAYGRLNLNFFGDYSDPYCFGIGLRGPCQRLYHLERDSYYPGSGIIRCDLNPINSRDLLGGILTPYHVASLRKG